MKIFVVGLGLMGSSYALKLHLQGHIIYGYDVDKNAIRKGQDEGFLQEDSDLKKLMMSDLVIFALYPNNTLEFIETHQHLFKSGALITDINGVKKTLIHKIEQILRSDIRYVSHHPMAGRAKRGFDAKDITMFQNNHFIIVETNRAQDSDYELMHIVAKQLGFKTVTQVSPSVHDKVIAYTSQLTHVIAASLILGQETSAQLTGDSFRELTRIANINEDLWTELFLNNQEDLLHAIAAFKKTLDKIEASIELNDERTLKELLKQSRKKREDFENHF